MAVNITYSVLVLAQNMLSVAVGLLNDSPPLLQPIEES